MANKKKAKQAKSGASAYARVILGDVTKRIGKHKYDIKNPEKASSTKRKKSNAQDKGPKPTKDVRPKRLTEVAYRKSKEEGLASLRKLRAKQRRRMK